MTTMCVSFRIFFTVVSINDGAVGFSHCRLAAPWYGDYLALPQLLGPTSEQPALASRLYRYDHRDNIRRGLLAQCSAGTLELGNEFMGLGTRDRSIRSAK
eukprot:scaffold22680_cov107-Cylindrotheca_fusiformis.AAC.3